MPVSGLSGERRGRCGSGSDHEILPTVLDDSVCRTRGHRSLRLVTYNPLTLQAEGRLALLACGLVADVPRIKTKDTIEIEPLDEESLP